MAFFSQLESFESILILLQGDVAGHVLVKENLNPSNLIPRETDGQRFNPFSEVIHCDLALVVVVTDAEVGFRGQLFCCELSDKVFECFSLRVLGLGPQFKFNSLNFNLGFNVLQGYLLPKQILYSEAESLLLLGFVKVKHI